MSLKIQLMPGKGRGKLQVSSEQPFRTFPCNAKAAIEIPLSCGHIKPIYCVKGWLWGKKLGFCGFVFFFGGVFFLSVGLICGLEWLLCTVILFACCKRACPRVKLNPAFVMCQAEAAAFLSEPHHIAVAL